MAARVPSASGDRREHALNARRAARVRTESLAWPIFFGTFAVVATLAVLVGWNIIFTRHYLTLAENRSADDIVAAIMARVPMPEKPMQHSADAAEAAHA